MAILIIIIIAILVTSRMIIIMEVISIVIVKPMNISRLQMVMRIDSLGTIMMSLVAATEVNIMVAVQSM